MTEEQREHAQAAPGGQPSRPGPPAALPTALRERVAALAAEQLGVLPADQVPPTLRAVARFTPAKRARLGAAPLLAALEADPVFRQRIADGLRVARPDLVTAAEEGGAASGSDQAALAYLLRLPGWEERVEEVRSQHEAVAAAAAGELEAVRRLGEQLEALRAAGRTESARLRAEADSARAEAAALRRSLRSVGDRAGRAEAAQRAAETALEQERAALAVDRQQAGEQVRRLQARLTEAEQALATARSAGREGRAHDELRLRLLLDALLGAAGGLRRELALPPLEGRPADAVAQEYAAEPPASGSPARGLAQDDPALLDALLAVPMVHLLVDGYNVTKGGYGDVPLQAQRERLLAGLGALGARTGAEVTVVFDGAERVAPLAAAAPRGVRLLFSPVGETADEVLRRLVRLEPAGRPLVVVSSDREVADGVRAAGARPVPSGALLRLLSRG